MKTFLQSISSAIRGMIASNSWLNGIWLIAIALAMVVDVRADISVTFVAGTDLPPENQSNSVVKSSVTVTAGAGSMAGEEYYQVNNGTNLKISCSTAQITKIEITCQESGNDKDGPGSLSFSGGDARGNYSYSGKVGTWKEKTNYSGSQNYEVSLATSKRVRFTQIVVYIKSTYCQYMVYDGSKYIVWKTLPQTDPCPVGPSIAGYDPMIAGSELFVWCELPITSSPCVSSGYINNTSGTYANKYRFVVSSPSEPKHYPNGASTLYAVYAKNGCQITTAPYVECASPFGTLSATDGTTVTWTGSNITKTINLTGKNGSGTVTWSIDAVSAVATISGSGSSATLTIKGTGGYTSTTITVTCHIAAATGYCEESKTIDITVNAQTFAVNYHLTGVTKTSGPTTVSRVDDDISVSFTVNDGYKSEGILGRVVVTDSDNEDWCYSTSAYTGCAVENIEFVGNLLDYVNDGVFTSAVDVYIVAQEDICTNPWMGFANGTNRTVNYGASGWTDAATAKVSAGGAATGQTISYSSSNPSVASVSAAGAVTINGVGTATISATAAKAGEYCEKTVSYTVTVNCVAPTTSANESGKAMTVSSVLPTSARIEGGIIVSLGGASSNTAHGFVYGTSPNPTLSNYQMGWTVGHYQKPDRKEGTVWGGWNIADLTPGTTYYVRTYVTTDCGTGYSPTEVSFTTPHQYYITYDANGGTGSISDQSKLEGTNVTLSDGTGFTRDGYTILKWNTAADGSGTNYTLGATYSGNANLDLFAIWQAGNYTVTLNNQSATTAGTASVAVTFNASTNLTSAIIKPTKTGYTFGGYFTAIGGAGSQLIGTDGNWIANVDGYTDADKKWQYAGNLEIYAKWTANEIELELSANGGESDGSAVVLYDATGLKAGSLTHAEYEGHNLVGYYQEEGHTHKILNSDGSFAGNVTGYITDGKWSRTTTPTTLYAFWATEIRTVTFDLQGKGDNFTQDVEYNTKVSRPTPDPSNVDYNFDGWYQEAACTNAFNFNTSITTNTTVYAKWTAKTYEHLIFSCVDFDLVTEDGEPVLVTSRNGVNVMATKKLILDVSGAVAGHRITLSGTDLKFYRNDGTRFIELTGANSLTAPATNQIVYVAYNPSSAGTGAIVTPDITVACDGFEETFSGKVKARNLPDAVAIVARVGDTWHALPANITTASTPAPIMVDVTTEVGILKAKGPSTVSYKLWSTATVNSVNNRWGDVSAYTPAAMNADHLRFAGNDNKALWANNSSSSNGINNNAAITAATDFADNEPAYEWTVTTTETDGQFVYTLQTTQTQNQNNLRLWGNKWGTYGTYGITELYILPLTVVQTADITVMEWGTNEIAVKYANAGNVASGTFKAKIGTGSQTDVTCTTLGGDIYKLTGVGNLQNNPAKTLVLTESETPKQAIFAIPLILTLNKTDAEISSLAAGGDGTTKITEGRAIAKNLDVIVRSGGKLTTSTAAGNFKDLYIYPGGKADLTNNIGLQNIYMRGGFSWLELPNKTEENFRFPQLKVTDGVEIDGVKDNGIYYDFYADYRMYYMIALPKDVYLSEVTNEENTKTFSAKVKWYDGSKRAGDNPMANCWVSPGDRLERGKGYEIAVQPRNSRSLGILRFPLMQGEEWTDEDDCTPAVRAHGMTAYLAGSVSANNVGWNIMGNPFFSAFTAGTDGIATDGLIPHKVNNRWDGTYEWTTTETKYFTIPKKTYYDYDDVRATSEKLESFYPFFIQAETSGNLSFLSDNRSLKAAPTFMRNTKMREKIFDFILENANGERDRAGLNISDDYSDKFDTDDKEKTIESGTKYMKVYTITDNYRVAFNSMSEARAAQKIPVGIIAPQQGTYLFTIPDDITIADIEVVNLIDYQEGITTNLIYDDYEFSTQAGEHNQRFALNVVMRTPEVVTELDNTGSGNLLDIRAYSEYGHITIVGAPDDAQIYVYDMNGKLICRQQTDSDSQTSRVRMTVPQGVYNVRVISSEGNATVKTIVR